LINTYDNEVSLITAYFQKYQQALPKFTDSELSGSNELTKFKVFMQVGSQ